jgi:hypothetical protein
VVKVADENDMTDDEKKSLDIAIKQKPNIPFSVDEKIETIEDAEKAIEQLDWIFSEEVAGMRISRAEALEILQRLKAGLREREEKMASAFERAVPQSTFYFDCFFRSRELRRVLSKSEVPEAERREVGGEK